MNQRVASNTVKIAQTAVIAALAVAFQLLSIPAPVTGVIINAIFITAAETTGTVSAYSVCAITPLAAMFFGILPAIFIPVVPFIIAANILYIYIYLRLNKKSCVIRIFAAAFKKALFIGIFAALVMYLAKPEMMKTAYIFAGMQFATSVAGGFLGYFTVRGIKKARYSPVSGDSDE